MKKPFLAAAVAVLAVLITFPAQARIRAGLLRCNVSPSVGYIVGSQKSLSCTYKSVFGYREHYVGRMTSLGLNVGFTDGGKLAWAVYAAARPGRGALAGGYGGASAEATVAAGLGANALVGGLGNSISLQPFSVGAQSGLNLAVGVSGLQLDWAR